MRGGRICGEGKGSEGREGMWEREGEEVLFIPSFLGKNQDSVYEGNC